MRRNEIQELRIKKRQVKRAMRRKRKELLDLENELKELNKHHKTLKQIELNKKHKEVLLAKARRGELRLSKREILQMITEEKAA